MLNKKRREFITLFGGVAATWPLAARAQQGEVPIIGFLHPGFPDGVGSPAFNGLRDGLGDAGYVEGATIKVEARWARGKPEILPRRGVSGNLGACYDCRTRRGCVMKVATLVFALLVTCGAAYADPNCNGCKSEDTPPVAGTAAPVPLLSAPPVRTADPCNGSGCKTKDAKAAGQSAVPPAWFPALFGKPGGM